MFQGYRGQDGDSDRGAWVVKHGLSQLQRLCCTLYRCSAVCELSKSKH